MSNEEKDEKSILVCRCEDVTLEEVEKAIDEGYTTLKGIKRFLRCGMGACQGRVCLQLIARVLSRKIGKSVTEMDFPAVRFPIRPVSLGILLAESSNEVKHNVRNKKNVRLTLNRET